MAASAEIGALRVRLAFDAGEFTKGVKQAESGMDKLAAKAQKLGTAIAGALATEAIINFGRAALAAFGESQDALAAVEAAVKSTGGTAGYTTKELAKMAEGLKAISTYDDEDILKNVSANLLTFTNVVADVFKEAQLQVLNLSARLGQDLQSSAIQVGKALNDPIKGITALRRVGVAFSASQRDMIKVMVESGNIMGAQRMILAELGKEFGGQAQALTTSVNGRLKQAANAFGDAMEAIGSAMAPVVSSAAIAIKSLSESFSELSPEMLRFVTFTTTTTVAMGALATAAAIAGAVLGTVSLPLVAIGAALAVVTGAVAAFWPNLQQMASVAAKSFYDTYQAAKTWLVDAFAPIIERVGAMVQWLKDTFGSLSEWLGAGEFMKALGSNFEATPMVEKVKDFATKVQNAWTVAGAESEKAAPAISKQLAAAQVQAGALAEAGAAKHRKAADEALAAQKRLVEEGVKLAEKVRTPYEVLADHVKALDAAMAAGKITAEQYGTAMRVGAVIAQGAYAGMASNIAGSLEKVFANSKAVAIAAALVNTYEAATKAYAAYPPPWNFAAAAAVVAAGLVQVANIRKTSKSSSGGGSSSGDSGSTAGTGGGSGSSPQVLTVQGINESDRYSGGQMRDFANAILKYQKDGGQVLIR